MKPDGSNGGCTPTEGSKMKKAGMNWYGKPVFNIENAVKTGENLLEIKVTTVLSNYVMSLENNPTAERWTRGYTKILIWPEGPIHLMIQIKWNGTVAEVLVNNQKAGIIAWEPEELDITELLSEGENEITVRVVGSLKNTFGEFYREEKSWIYGPHGWNNAPEHQPGFEQYFLNDYGLFKPFELLSTNLMKSTDENK